MDTETETRLADIEDYLSYDALLPDAVREGASGRIRRRVSARWSTTCEAHKKAEQEAYTAYGMEE